MTKSDPDSPKKPGEPSREQRLAKALRENLRRRKSAAPSPPPPEEPAS
jgi:hypothetical protein